MLKELAIQNFAIIDELKVVFKPELNIITGETGAGKSILLGALGLVLGKRADSSVLQNKEKKCIVEVLFDSPNEKLKAWLQDQEIDEQEDLILRREINNTGKSRAFINDTPVTLVQLKELTSLLVDLHQQFDTLELGEASIQREILDAMSDCLAETENYNQQYVQYAKLKKELELLKEQQLTAQKEKEYHQFLYDELIDASFKENELEQTEQELKLLNNSGAIATVLSAAVVMLKEGDAPVVQQLKSLLQKLLHYKDLNEHFSSITNRLQSTQIELADIASELNHLQNSITVDEQKLKEMNERIELGYKLQKKHGVNSTNALLETQKGLSKKIQYVVNLDDKILTKEKEKIFLQKQLDEAAKVIHLKREKEAVPLSIKINELLQKVGMPNAKLKVVLTESELNAFGKNEINFLFDANKSNRYEPIYKVASGGELSRLMLCIKSLVATKVHLPTMVFDEIDTGISGEAAKQVGILLKELSGNHQVITITHLPQIAAKANTHYFVYKTEENTGIKTRIKELNKVQQIETIAQMLSGKNFSESTLITAKEMVGI